MSVIQLGWILATVDGSELVAYEKLWRLPAGERIHSKAFKAHGITAARLRHEGVDHRHHVRGVARGRAEVEGLVHLFAAHLVARLVWQRQPLQDQVQQCP